MKPLLFVMLLAFNGCTAGGITPNTGGGTSAMTITKINVSLAAYPQTTIAAGTSLGFSPAQTTVSLGTGVQFVNVDNTSHTASSFAGSAFPSVSPLTISATSSTGATLSGGFSSGTLQAGASSQVLLVDRAGTYLYGCFFHYSGNMRGAIVAQ